METIIAVVNFTEEQSDLISIIMHGFLTTVECVVVIGLLLSLLYTDS